MSADLVVSIEKGPEQQPLESFLPPTELPIAGYRDEIVDSLLANQVTIIVSPTGTGKTTQVPQYALETNQFDRITLTQPRITAARELARRIDDETDDYFGVGHYTARDSSAVPQHLQDVAVMTDGKASKQLMHDKGKRPPINGRKNLVIVDEAHEWNIHTENLLAQIKLKTDKNSPHYDPNISFVIMSASINSQPIKRHYEDTSTVNIIDIDAKFHPVEEVTWNCTAPQAIEEIARANPKSKIITFLPGVDEIRLTNDALTAEKVNKTHELFSLHAKIPKKAQQEAVRGPDSGPYAVQATDIAQTSLTFDGATHVVDTGLVRNAYTDYSLLHTGSKVLALEHAPQSYLIQRRGRVGRTGPGVYTLVSPSLYPTQQTKPTKRGYGKKPKLQTPKIQPPVSMNARPEYLAPEIQRISIDGIALDLKIAGFDIRTYPFLHKPSETAIKAAEKKLFNLGATDEFGEPTVRGRIMSRLPLDSEYSCMIASAAQENLNKESFDALARIVTIMQIGGLRNPKALLETKEDGEPKEIKSDFIAQYEAYLALKEIALREEENSESNVLVEKIESDALELIGRIGRNKFLSPAKPLTAEQRRNLLEHIITGQVNQIWEMNYGGTCNEINSGLEATVSNRSIVAATMGQLAVGELITISNDPNNTGQPTPKRIVYNINVIDDPQRLLKLAPQIVSETARTETLTYDGRTFFVKTIRRIGHLVLADDTLRAMNYAEYGLTEEKLRITYQKYMIRQLNNDRSMRHPRMRLDEINRYIKNPLTHEYGKDYLTGEPMVAYLDGQGRWQADEKVAQISMEKAKDRVERGIIYRQQKAILTGYKKELRPFVKSNKVIEEWFRSNKTSTRVSIENQINEATTLLGLCAPPQLPKAN